MATTTNQAIYRGFSTKAWETGNKGFRLTNKELVKQDLLNHIFTSKGERVMMPNFGTRIPSLPFEPLDAATTRIIEEDITEVINFDPRVALLNLQVIPLSDHNTIIAYVTIQYLELGGTEDFNIEVSTGAA